MCTVNYGTETNCFLCCIGTMFMSCIETGVKKYASDCYPAGLHSMLLFLICDLDV